MSLSTEPSSLIRRKALRARSRSDTPRPVPLADNFAPKPARQQTQLHLATPADVHRLSISSINSISTSSTCDMPMPITPPLRPTELMSQPTDKLEVLDPYRHHSRSTSWSSSASGSSSSSYAVSSPAYSEVEAYDAQRIREVRARMAKDLLEKRRAERRQSWGSLGTIMTKRSDETHISQWSADRDIRFAEWERREADALARQRSLDRAQERDREYKLWQRSVRSERARTLLISGSASLSRHSSGASRG